ncbi:MAG: hypothetical protein U5N58_05045 [Actinomycetota bacterium]|nr:hypothetical protein [Actinomycetota bacterium]
MKSRALPWIMLALMAAAIVVTRVFRVNIPILFIILGLGSNTLPLYSSLKFSIK